MLSNTLRAPAEDGPPAPAHGLPFVEVHNGLRVDATRTPPDIGASISAVEVTGRRSAVGLKEVVATLQAANLTGVRN